MDVILPTSITGKYAWCSQFCDSNHFNMLMLIVTFFMTKFYKPLLYFSLLKYLSRKSKAKYCIILENNLIFCF